MNHAGPRAFSCAAAVEEAPWSARAAAAERSVMEKRGYWLGEREATSSTSAGKCKACDYNSVCPKSLFRPT